MENINGKELLELQNKGEKVLVDFWAPWCAPCRSLMPVLESIEKDYSNFKFVKVNIDENMDFALEMGVTSVPTVMFFEGKTLIDKKVGLNPSTTYKVILESSNG